MGISYQILSDQFRSYQIISQLRFNMFKLALLLVTFAAVHLAQGGSLVSSKDGSLEGKAAVYYEPEEGVYRGKSIPLTKKQKKKLWRECIWECNTGGRIDYMPCDCKKYE